MEVHEAIKQRRAFRSLDPVPADKNLIRDLAEHAALSPSCFNYQPWRFVFVHTPEMLEQLLPAISSGNAWASRASMIVAVFSQKKDDCLINEREYYLFDTGMATAFLLLRATELGLVAHPIAGFNEVKVKEVLSIPEDFRLITLLVVGKKADTIHAVLSEKQAENEEKRPPRIPFEKFAFFNIYEPE